MVILSEVRGDLFTSSNSLAHCVSADLVMGKGIAKEFKARFGGISLLYQQQPLTGKTLSLLDGKRNIYYLVTKDRYYHKPTLNTMKLALEDLKKKLQPGEHLSIPKLDVDSIN